MSVSVGRSKYEAGRTPVRYNQAGAFMATYKAVIQRDGEWWVGWIEEIPGVNSQGATREELLENLRSGIPPRISSPS